MNTDAMWQVLRLVAPEPTSLLAESHRDQLRVMVGRRWQDDASCASADPESWFPVKGAVPPRQVPRICGQCPVRRSCLAVALLWNEDGIWAGTNPRHRHEGYRHLAQGVPVVVVVRLLLTDPRRLTTATRPATPPVVDPAVPEAA